MGCRCIGDWVPINPMLGRQCVFWCFVGLVISGVGCSNDRPEIVAVSGRVTFQGEPVSEGVVLFVSETSFGTSAGIETDGSFTLLSHYGQGIPLGQYQVAVTPPDDDEEEDASPAIDSYPNIPQKYRDLATSELVFTVTEGENHFEIDLQ